MGEFFFLVMVLLTSKSLHRLFPSSQQDKTWSPDEHTSYYPNHGWIVNRNFPCDSVSDMRLSSDSWMMFLFRGLFAGIVNTKRPFGTRKKVIPGYTIFCIYRKRLLFFGQGFRDDSAKLDRGHWAAARYDEAVSFDGNTGI
jgi:hypothetical protein